MKLDSVDPADVAFGNLFVGSERCLVFESGSSSYSVWIKPKNLGLEAKVSLKVKIADMDAEILLSSFSNIGKMDERFAAIDPMLFDDELKLTLLNCLLEKEIASFSAKSGIAVQLLGVSAGSSGATFDREIGVNLARNDSDVITFNVRLNRELVEVINSKFEKIGAARKEIDPKLPMEWYIEIGRTNLTAQAFQNLEECDIIFLDDDSSIRSGRYEIRGLEGMKLLGKLDGCNLVLERRDSK